MHFFFKFRVKYLKTLKKFTYYYSPDNINERKKIHKKYGNCICNTVASISSAVLRK